MKYYAINGNSIAIADKVSTLKRYYQNVQKLPDDYYERCYIVQDGKLVIDDSAEKTKAIDNLDSQYNSEITRLGNEYHAAQLRGDTDIQMALVGEMASLDTWYDEEYEKIVGGGE